MTIQVTEVGNNGVAYVGPREDDLDGLLYHLQTSPTLAVDTETISLKDRSLIGIGLSPNPTEGYYFRNFPDPSPYFQFAIDLIKERTRTKIYHNAMFDLGVLSSWNPDMTKFEDTSIMAQVQAYTPKLKDIMLDLFGQEVDEIDDILPNKRGSNTLDLPWHVVGFKCITDTRSTYRLYEEFVETLGVNGARSNGTYECYRIDRDLVPLLLRMSRRGIKLREDVLETWYKDLSQRSLYYRDICADIGVTGFNPGSPVQVGKMLASRGNLLPYKRRKWGQPKPKNRFALDTSSTILAKVDDPLARVILNFRKASKLLSTYVKPWRGHDRAYTNFRIDLSTGRLASYNRNLQNIPPSNRDIFAPDSGLWTDADLSQVEMRVFAYLSQDPVMLEAYRTGVSIHWITQQALWPGTPRYEENGSSSYWYRLAKTFNFAMIYFATAETLSAHTGLPVEVCAEFRERWLHRYYVAYQWMIRMMEEDTPYAETIFGRKMLLPKLGLTPTGQWITQDHINKCKINYPVQGSAADLIKRAMRVCGNYDLALQVHDEILIDGDVTIPTELDMLHPGLLTPFEVKPRSPYWN